MIIVWIIVLVAAILVEAATLALVSIWLAGGALVAAIVALCGGSLTAQLVVFVVVSFVLLAVTRPLLKKIMPNKYTPTNTELDVGKQAVVIETIDKDSNTGRVKLDGVDWNAESEDGSVIQKDAIVVVSKVGTTKLTVNEKK